MLGPSLPIVNRLDRCPIVRREQVDHVKSQVVADGAGGEDFEGERDGDDVPRAQARGLAVQLKRLVPGWFRTSSDS